MKQRQAHSVENCSKALQKREQKEITAAEIEHSRPPCETAKRDTLVTAGSVRRGSGRAKSEVCEQGPELEGVTRWLGSQLGCHCTVPACTGLAPVVSSQRDCISLSYRLFDCSPSRAPSIQTMSFVLPPASHLTPLGAPRRIARTQVSSHLSREDAAAAPANAAAACAGAAPAPRPSMGLFAHIGAAHHNTIDAGVSSEFEGRAPPSMPLDASAAASVDAAAAASSSAPAAAPVAAVVPSSSAAAPVGGPPADLARV